MTHLRVALCLLLLLSLFPGCLLVRITEQRVKLNDDGSGDALMRLIDIRSDGVNDSLIVRDFGIMMASSEREGIDDFERTGRKVTSKQFVVRGDTLSAEIAYTFSSLTAIEGLHATKDELFVVVGEGREVTKTNGKVGVWDRNTTRIMWDRDAKRLMFQIREKTLPPSTSLASLYLNYKKP